jgi:hypothetical protein
LLVRELDERLGLSALITRRFESICYHPLLLFNGEGDCLGATLRPGKVHIQEGDSG